MFERYTEKARRVVFFARYEASQYDSPYIEAAHILLGILREDKALDRRFLRAHNSAVVIRRQIDAHTTVRDKISTSVDLPLSNDCERVLAYAAEEADLLTHRFIGTGHLLLGMLREEKCLPLKFSTSEACDLPPCAKISRAPAALPSPSRKLPTRRQRWRSCQLPGGAEIEVDGGFWVTRPLRFAWPSASEPLPLRKGL